MGSHGHPASCIDNGTCDEPMLWIGIYIAIASLLCTLAMAADLLHGFRSKKFWFPCNYFSLNAASITVITVTMKLPVDLSTEMPSFMDQAAKMGSLGFMCAMMANLMPSLASMDNKTLLANVIGLCILVITMIVNICIQLKTGAIREGSKTKDYGYSRLLFVNFAYIYTVMIFLLLVLIISSSLTIPTSKETLESKYQATKKISSTRQMSKVEKLRQDVRKYWVMAETGSPQFGMASNPLSTASGVICVIVLILKLLSIINYFSKVEDPPRLLITGGSSYRWSTNLIYITQSIGVLVGTFAPISRCFSFYSFKLNTKWNRRYFMFFKVENHWIQKLNEWKKSAIPFQSRSLKSSLVYNSKNIIMSLCIGLQMVIVISCKVIWFIVTVVPIFVACTFTTLSTSGSTDEIDEDLSNYVIQIDNEMELAEKTLKRISKSMDCFLSKAEKEQNDNLLELLKKSTGFEGVEIFDTIDNVKLLHSFELANNWSLPIVTLTCIAVALPNICKHAIESLLRSVGEGLSFTHLVEENLNSENEYVNIRKTTMILWHEVENKRKWLDNPLAKIVYKEKKATEIVKSFSDKAKEIMRDINGTTNKEAMENPPHMLIAANSMYRITQTLLLRYQSNIEPVTKKQLFAHLNGIIADIFSACFTNIPRVITMRCNESVIEKREASVKVATKLLGKTTKIIERLETLELPSMDDDKMAYIDEWLLHLKQSVPQGA